MKCGRTPEQVVGDPTDVVDQLVVVRVGEQGVRVRRVHGKKRDDAPDEEIEGRCTLAVVDREANRGREEQDVTKWVGGRYSLLERCQPGEMDVRSDEKHPGEQGDADRDDQRVDNARSVAARVAPPHENEQPCHQSGIDGEIDRVSERRELHLDAHELRIAVGVEVAGEEQEVADDEEQPGDARFRPVKIDPHCDRDRRREPEQVDQRPTRLERWEPQICRGEEAPDSEVNDPGAPAPVESSPHTHAA